MRLTLDEMKGMSVEEVKEVIKGIDKKINGKLTELDFQTDCLNSIEETIYSLEDDIDGFQSEKKILEEELERKHFEETVGLNNKLPSDDFHKAFLLMSEFTSKEFDSNRFTNYVKIESDRLITCDGYRFVVMEVKAPEELFGTLVRWDEREGLLEGAAKAKEEDMIFNILPDEYLPKEHYNEYFHHNVINFSKFEEIYLDKELTENNKNDNVYIYNIDNHKLAIRKAFIEDARKVFGDNRVDIKYPKNYISPLIIKSDKCTMIILPVRMWGMKA